MPVASVIMGVYNCKNIELLEKSIHSIICQTYTDWEFLICDDGSTNGTKEQLQRLGKLDPRIQILGYEKNRGLSGALNECLKYAKGKYIAREDDDDYSELDRLKKQVDFLENHHEFDLVGSNATVINDTGVWGQYTTPEYPQKTDFLWNSPFLHPSIMITKKAIDALEGYRSYKHIGRCEDYDLFMRFYAKGYRGYNIQENLYNYWIQNDPNVNYRPMNIRINEAVVRYKGFKAMGILGKGIPFILKPVVLGLIPSRLFSKLRKTQY